MDALTIPGASADTLTMSSLEISGLVESNHADVRRSIERLGNRGVIALPPLAEVSNDGPGPKTISVYNLCKRDSLIVVAQLCPEFTARIIDRWQALEEQVAKPAIDPMQILSDPAAMRGLLLTYTEKVLALESKVEALAPKAEALERIAEADGLMNCTVAAKALQIQPKRLFDWLRANHWIYRRPGGAGNVAYQDKIQCGYLTHKVTTVQREDGSEKVVEQVLVTGKGLAKLSQSFRMH